jgi:hypothetical protein
MIFHGPSGISGVSNGSGGLGGPLAWHGKHISIPSFAALSILGSQAYWRITKLWSLQDLGDMYGHVLQYVFV